MFVYGPVPSRRLGRSLGVSPIPAKTCSYSCVYCQLGRTTRLQVVRESFYPKEDILGEIIDHGRIAGTDYVTFAGDGEPTLCEDLGWLIHQTKQILHLPVAVITNGSLLFRDDVRTDLAEADVVLPSLDAGNEEMFRKVNRRHGSISFATMLQGQIDFRRGYSGHVWLETMLVNDLNDKIDELQDIRQAASAINPDRIYITAPFRPPVESWVKAPTATNILRAQRIIGNAMLLAEHELGEFGVQDFSDARQAIMEIGSRHPLRKKQAKDIEEMFTESGTVDRMLTDGELVEVRYGGRKYLMPQHLVRDS